jgi:hypothetical protein
LWTFAHEFVPGALIGRQQAEVIVHFHGGKTK